MDLGDYVVSERKLTQHYIALGCSQQCKNFKKKFSLMIQHILPVSKPKQQTDNDLPRILRSTATD